MRITLLVAALFALLACSESRAPQPKESGSAEPAQEAVPVSIDVPAGQYLLDPGHSSLSFSVTHLGLSNYVMRFTDFKVAAELNPANLPESSVTVAVDPTSIRTDFAGDYQGTHPESPYSSWEDDLVQSPKFLHAGEHPTIAFESTRVTPTDGGTLRIDGDLTLLGQTKPITLTAELVGAQAEHPFTGVGALGFSATGSFKRSDFGMNHLLEPPLVGDVVTLRFEGELHQVADGSALQSVQ